MKKIFLEIASITLLVVMLFVLTGCSNSDTQKDSNNSLLSKKVNIGDYVDYKVKSGNTYTSTAEKTGIDKEQVFETTGKEKWRVLNIEDNGNVNLISADGIVTKFEKEYSLFGEKGYTNGVDELNNISKIYATGKHAISARSMNLLDLVNLIGIDKIAKVYENESEVNLSSYSGTEKLEQAYKLMNEEYGKTYTFDGQTKTVNSAFEISSSMNTFGIDKITEDERVIDLLKTSNGEIGKYVWLADNIVDVGKIGQEATYFECGLARYDVTNRTQYDGYTGAAISSSIGFTVLHKINHSEVSGSYPQNFIRPVVTMDKDTKIAGGEGTVESPYILE